MKKRVMALDVGFKRIGVAVTDPLNLTAQPLTVIVRKSNEETFKKLEEIIKEKNVGKIIIGIPLNREGKKTKIGEKIEKFGEKLKSFLKGKGIEVEFFDESYSTQEASEITRKNRKREKQLDHIAAAVILRDWLNS